MKGNYIAVFVHAIWSTKHRIPVLPKPIRYPLFVQIRKCAEENNIDLRIINGVDDHVHCVFRMVPTQNLAWVVKTLKGPSSRWLNDQFFENPEGMNTLQLEPIQRKYLGEIGKFSWQDGYGALSVSPQNVGSAIRYVFNQEKHHHRYTLEEELKMFQTFIDAIE